MALIDLSNYADTLYQSSDSRAGTPDGNVYFNKSTGQIEFIDATELASFIVTDPTHALYIDGTTPSSNPLIEQDGLKFEAIYAFENQERASDETLRAYDRWTSGTFKFGGAYNFINGRVPATAADRNIIRGSGWNEIGTDGAVDKTFFGNKGLSNIEATSAPYYQLGVHTTAIPYAKVGQIDEAVLVFEDGGTDNTLNPEIVSVRTYGYNYDRKATDTDLGIAELGGYSTGFAVNESPHLTSGNYPYASVVDDSTISLSSQTIDFTATEVVLNNATASDNDWVALGFGVGSSFTISGSTTAANDTTYVISSISTTTDTNDTVVTTVAPNTAEVGTGSQTLVNVQVAPFATMSIEELDTPVTRDEFAETSGNFTWVLNNPGTGTNASPVDAGTLDECIAYLDAQATLTTDINAHSTNTDIGKDIDVFYSYNAAGQVVTVSGANTGTTWGTDAFGMYIYNVPTADQQRVKFTDDAGNTKSYQFLVGVEANVGATAKADVNAWYHSYFAADYNTASAVEVQDAGSSVVKGLASSADGSNLIKYNFDYDGDTLGGTAGTDKNAVFLCEGDGGATQAKTLYTLTRSTTISFTCAPGVENNA